MERSDATGIDKRLPNNNGLTGKGPYTFQRTTAWATDGVPLSGYGYPVKPNGLICSTFRPSDDCTLFPYLVPSNMFAIEVLGKLAELCSLPAMADQKTSIRSKKTSATGKEWLRRKMGLSSTQNLERSLPLK